VLYNIKTLAVRDCVHCW